MKDLRERLSTVGDKLAEPYSEYEGHLYKVGFQALSEQLAALAEALGDLAGGCANTGFYGHLGISPGGCTKSKHSCAHCRGREALRSLETFLAKEEGKS